MEQTVEDKIKALFKLQEIDSRVDEIRAVRGELPMEVADLEDDITGLQTRIENQNNEVKELEEGIQANKNKIKESEQFIKKYQGQLDNVKNNREYDALNKEIEIQGLEIQAAEKRIGEHKNNIELKKDLIKTAEEELDSRKKDLEFKKKELESITKETEKEETKILKEREKAEKQIEERLLNAYDKIRGAVKNGIAVATIERDSCGGCFASIPPQRQVDIRQRKKITVCENCGRILVDSAMAEEAATAKA